MNGFFILNYKDSERTVLLAKKAISLNFIDFVFVFDNSCDPDEKDKLSSLSHDPRIITHYSHDNLGYNKGLTTGLKMCSSMNPDYVFVANSDVDFEEITLFNLLKTIRDYPNIGIVSCGMIENNLKVQNYYNYPSFKYICLALSGLGHFKKNEKVDLIEIGESVYEVDFVRNSLVLIDYEVCKKVDFFDDDLFMYFGESALSKKLSKIGYKECIDFNLNYYHNHIFSKKSKLKSWVNYFRDSKVYLQKYGKFSKLKNIILHISFGLGYVFRFCLRFMIKR